MWIWRLLWSGFVAAVLTSLLIFFFGEKGQGELEKLKMFQSQVSANLQTLKRQNQELTARFEALQKDPGTVALEARKLGYWKDSEIRITLPGREYEEQTLPTERVLTYDFKQDYREDFFRWMFLLTGIMTFLFLSFLGPQGLKSVSEPRKPQAASGRSFPRADLYKSQTRS